MTDNLDAELRELLDERDIEYAESQDRFRTRFRFNYCEACGDYLDEIEVMGACITASKSYLTPEQAIAATLGSEINGGTSDGYHTFNELYHHRAVLFSVIVRDHRDIAWKARKHHDGTMYDGMFIVGIETQKGQATYHYDLDPYWEMFDCEEREFAPEWDGHTPDEAIARIAELGSEPPYDELIRYLENDWHIRASWDGLRRFWNIELTEEGVKLRDEDYNILLDELGVSERTCECIAEYAESPIDGKTIVLHRCSACHELMRPHMRYCPNCGVKVIQGVDNAD